MPQIYAASDIFSMLSKFDTFGMAALEAMAASLPVLVSSMVGARDLVAQGHNGYVVSRDASPDEVCEKLNLMSENLGQMAENAFRTAQGHSWQKAADETEKIYREFLDTKKPD
jgi:glycosyltransferase involved in cell wall biosynthesis